MKFVKDASFYDRYIAIDDILSIEKLPKNSDKRKVTLKSNEQRYIWDVDLDHMQLFSNPTIPAAGWQLMTTIVNGVNDKFDYIIEPIVAFVIADVCCLPVTIGDGIHSELNENHYIISPDGKFVEQTFSYTFESLDDALKHAEEKWKTLRETFLAEQEGKE